jgi:hypothetical protein
MEILKKQIGNDCAGIVIDYLVGDKKYHKEKMKEILDEIGDYEVMFSNIYCVYCHKLLYVDDEDCYKEIQFRRVTEQHIELHCIYQSKWICKKCNFIYYEKAVSP